MNQRDLELIVDALAPAIVDAARKATLPLIERIEKLEAASQQSERGMVDMAEGFKNALRLQHGEDSTR